MSMLQRPALVCLACLLAVRAHADCIDDAAAQYQVNAYVLRAIGWQESSLNPRAFHENTNGTADIGAFQINSVHLPGLLIAGITPQALRDGCVCAYVAAWHYRRQVDRFGNTWRAVGAYHSTTPHLNTVYADRIAAILISWGLLAPASRPVPAPPPRNTRRPRSHAGSDTAPDSSTANFKADDGVVLDLSSLPRSDPRVEP